MLPLNIVERVDALLLEQLPLSIIVLHVLHQLGHVDEAVPGVHHVLNDKLNEADLALRYGARGSDGEEKIKLMLLRVRSKGIIIIVPVKHRHNNRHSFPLLLVGLGEIFLRNSTRSESEKKFIKC